jgi:hypothetical protein
MKTDATGLALFMTITTSTSTKITYPGTKFEEFAYGMLSSHSQKQD